MLTIIYKKMSWLKKKIPLRQIKNKHFNSEINSTKLKIKKEYMNFNTQPIDNNFKNSKTSLKLISNSSLNTSQC